MTYETAILVATRALFYVATAGGRHPAWIGPDDDIEAALAVLLPALLAESPAGVCRTEITGCASAAPKAGDPRQLALPVVEAPPPPRARCSCGGFAASDGLCSPCRLEVESGRAAPDPSPTPAELAEQDAVLALAKPGARETMRTFTRAFVPERDGPALLREVTAELRKLEAKDRAKTARRRRKKASSATA